MSLVLGDVFYHCVDPAWDDPPHPKIVVHIDSQTVYFVKGTTDEARVEKTCRRFEKVSSGRNLRTKITVVATASNGLSSTSHVDCNLVFSVRVQDIQSPRHGNIGASLLKDIQLGIICSPKHSPVIKGFFITPQKS